MYGIDRFSKKSFIALCDDLRQKSSARHNFKGEDSDNVEKMNWDTRVSYGIYSMFGQLKDEVEQGAIVNDKGRFTEAALRTRIEGIYLKLKEELRFNHHHGCNQVEGRPMPVIKDYLVWNAAHHLLISYLSS